MPIRRLFGRTVTLSRSYSIASELPQNKVAILGANGGIGQPLALMLKRSAFVSKLALYDIQDTRGVCADLSHISSKATVYPYVGKEQLEECLTDSSIVVMLAGTARKPGMQRDDLFAVNSNTVAELTSAVADYCPNAHLCMITSPVNSNIPMAAEILKRRGVHDPRRLFGITALDTIRANVLYAQLKGLHLKEVDVPVIGGHSSRSIVPLFSQTRPVPSETEIAKLTEAVSRAAGSVVEAKAGRGSATLSVAAAVHMFLQSLMRALDGRQNVIVPAYVESNVTEVPYFSSRQLLGRNGVEKSLEIGQVNDKEAQLLQAAYNELRQHIEKGQQFGKQWNG